MKRVFWFGAGVAVGVLAVQVIRRQATRFTPATNPVGGLLGSVRDFIADVRAGMADREAEISTAFEEGYDLDGWDDESSPGGSRR